MPQYITGLVVEKNNHNFITSGQLLQRGSSSVFTTLGLGVLMGDIPVPGNSNGGASIDGDYWAVPVDDGTYAGWNFIPYNLNLPLVQPDPQAFPVFKLSLNPPFGSDYWIVVGTTTQYLTAAGGGAALPTSIVYSGSTTYANNTLAQTPCQTLCNQNSTTGLYFAVLGVPTNSGGSLVNYYPYGYFNGVPLPLASATGYATTAALLTFLNASWSIVGTWTLTSNGSILVTEGSSAPGTDILCASIVVINPS